MFKFFQGSLVVSICFDGTKSTACFSSLPMLSFPDSCPAGTFACSLSEGSCFPQRSVCDNHNDCLNGEDEDSALCSAYLLKIFAHPPFIKKKSFRLHRDCGKNFPRKVFQRIITFLILQKTSRPHIKGSTVLGTVSFLF